MTVDDAVRTFRDLQWAADEDWPMGYDPDQVAAKVLLAHGAVDRHLRALPEAERAAEAKRIRERVEARVPLASEAQVAPRKRRIA